MLFVATSAFADGDISPASDLSQIEKTLAQGENEHALGNFESARQRLQWVLSKDYRAPAAQAAYRLAEIDEQLLWATPREGSLLRDFRVAATDIASFLAGVRAVRASYEKVTTLGDTFWSQRAAYRVITLMDDAIWEIRSRLIFPNFSLWVSPFEFLFTHLVHDDALDRQVLALEQERAVLESTLLLKLKNSGNDPILFDALKDHANDAYAMSPSFEQLIAPPWSGRLAPGLIIKSKGAYYRIEMGEGLVPVRRAQALELFYRALSNASAPLPFAFALAYLADEKEPLPEATLLSALQSDNDVVRIAALYAAQQMPSHQLTDTLLALLSTTKKEDENLFRSSQAILFGARERLLMSLAAHMALGRDSTRKILTSQALDDDEKAWLLQFRRDRNSSEVATQFLRHKNPLVRARARYAMSTWQAHGG